MQRQLSGKILSEMCCFIRKLVRVYICTHTLFGTCQAGVVDDFVTIFFASSRFVMLTSHTKLLVSFDMEQEVHTNTKCSGNHGIESS